MTSRTWSLPPFKVRIAEAYDTPEIRALLADPNALLESTGAEVLLAGRNRVAAAKIPLGGGQMKDVVVKEFRLRGIDALKSAVLPSKAAKAWRGAEFLRDAGFETPAPIACLEKRKNGFVERSYFIAERVAGGREIRELFQGLPDGLLSALLFALAGTLFGLHEKGILHRDLSDGNILVRTVSEELRFVFLDTNRVRKRTRLSSAARANNLIRLGIPPAFQDEFLHAYAYAAKSFPPSRSFLRRYTRNKRTFSGWIKFKKALRLKKIARKLRIQ